MKMAPAVVVVHRLVVVIAVAAGRVVPGVVVEHLRLPRQRLKPNFPRYASKQLSNRQTVGNLLVVAASTSAT